MHPLNGALPVPYVPVRLTRGAFVAHEYTYEPPRSTTGLFFPSLCLCGTIVLTLYSMVRDWPVSRAGQCFLIGLSCSIHSCFLLFSLSRLSFYRLVLWGWGLWTDRVLIALFQPCIADFFQQQEIIIMNIWTDESNIQCQQKLCPPLTCLLSERSVLFPTSMMMTSLPRSVRTSSIHLDVWWKELASASGGTAL